MVFVSVMISSELEKSKTKCRDGIISVLLIISIIGFARLALMFKNYVRLT